jgi:solute carrier family 25 S-adenosylmethionine transporter 26
MAVDISLYPLDTIKTRLQAPNGFLKSGGFKGLYKGLNVTALGSAPGGLSYKVISMK